TFHIDRDFLRQVAVGDGRGDVGDVAHLAGQVAGHEVHAFRKVLPGAGHTLHVGRAAERRVGTDFAVHARPFRGEGDMLSAHGVDGVLHFENFAFDVDGDLLGQVALGDGGGDVGDVAHLAGQVTRHEIHAFRKVLPGAGHTLHVGLTAQYAFGADLAGHARHFRGERTELLDHG